MENPTATKQRPSSGTEPATTEPWSYLSQTISVYQITILVLTSHFHDTLLPSFLSFFATLFQLPVQSITNSPKQDSQE
jgi:hypothetical protein